MSIVFDLMRQGGPVMVALVLLSLVLYEQYFSGDAQAKVVLAEASQRAIQKVTEVIQDNEMPIVYLLGERYIEAVKEVSTSDNAKLVMLPADIPAAIRGIMGSLGK